ncbi:hypothetical protein PVAND_004630 [Polypedilum vanderplanki]|uniref:CHK kinase-like domain-containing protein n=1 Tax=Polypedilum vanderplanki TaxID=319348 RepID=A0A9J6BZN9_POLVA|nr:hypothetical protein PVAND_004630 [Polypedilum vanderplanki]
MFDPSVYTKYYFQEILISYFKCNSILVKKLNIGPCNVHGDGFLSVLHRITINYQIEDQTKSINIVAKSDSNNEFTLEKIGPNGYDVQNKEIKFFSQIAPEMEKIFGNGTILNVIYIDKANKILVFKDLKDENFQMASRMIGLNEKHMKLSLSKLAKFHAASLKMLAKNPQIFDEFDVGMFSRKIDVFNKTCLMLFTAAGDEVATWEGYEIYAEKMKNLRKYFIENATRCFDVKKNELNVLNHGDMWTTNVMFKYDKDGNVADAIIFDFQFCHYGSIALDLNHFFFTSLNDDLYNHKDIERLLQFYYYELKKILLGFDYDLTEFPNLHQFIMEFYQKLFYGFVYASCIIPIMTSDDPDNNFENHHSENEKANKFRKKIMKNERFLKNFRKILPYFDQMGILDEI